MIFGLIVSVMAIENPNSILRSLAKLWYAHTCRNWPQCLRAEHHRSTCTLESVFRNPSHEEGHTPRTEPLEKATGSFGIKKAIILEAGWAGGWVDGCGAGGQVGEWVAGLVAGEWVWAG